MATGATSSTATAVALTTAMRRLRGRMRRESHPSPEELSMPQALALGRIIEAGPISNAALAADEHVRPQSMSEIVSALDARGLVRRRADPDDGRASLIEATAAGRRLVERILAARHAWLAAAIEDELTAAERRTLAAAAALLERLAASGPGR